MNKKFFFITSFLLIFIIIISNFSYAYVEVTEDNLNSAFQSLISVDNENLKLTDKNAKITLENNSIKLVSKGETYNMTYSLTGKPTFSIEVPVKNGMSYDEYTKKTEGLSAPLLGYVAVANIQGVKLEDAFTYIVLSSAFRSLANNSNNSSAYVIYDGSTADESITFSTSSNNIINKEDFPNRVMDYVNSLYGKKMIVADSDSDSLNSYEYTVEEKDITASSCTLVAKLTVNTDADFSKLSGYLNSLTSSMNNNTQTTNKTTNTNSNISGSNSNKENNDYNSNIFPKTGKETNYLIVTLFSIIIICIFGIVFLKVFSKNKK